jgi:hypothetical protein
VLEFLSMPRGGFDVVEREAAGGAGAARRLGPGGVVRRLRGNGRVAAAAPRARPGRRHGATALDVVAVQVADLGSGRIVASAREAPNMFASLVRSG